MLLLRFAFENHGSFRDEVDLTLVRPSLRTSRPLTGSWADHTAAVAAIYGANASGKSGVLDALRYMLAVIENSAAAWAGRKVLPRNPFALDETSRKRPSTFTIDFVLEDVRHEYGFSVTAKSIVDEWLYVYPTGRKKVLFDRNGAGGEMAFGRALGGGVSTIAKLAGPRELILSRGALMGHGRLQRIWQTLVGSTEVAQFGDADRHVRLRSVIREVAEGSFDLEDLRVMLRVADVGIDDAEVREQTADPRLARILKAIIRAQLDGDDELVEETVEELPEEKVEAFLAELARSLLFRHLGAEGKAYALSSAKQSTGTLTWLSLAAPALKAIREGGVLAVDELDSSLHPQLAEVLIQMFKDDSVNTKHAQLVFTTHDTYFMSSGSTVQLRPDEVWFVEKSRNGVSELFRLSDFPNRSDQNFSRRYLQGRYGAVPSVAPSFLAALAEKGRDSVGRCSSCDGQPT